MNPWFQIADDVFFDENIEGVFILSDSGEVYVLEDDVSKAVWNMLADSPQSLDEMCQHTKQKFNIGDDDHVEDDIRDFVTALSKIGVLKECMVPADRIS
ncbi:PqqD family protein [Paenibacillus sp. 1781tsa1]|uniref:PqqD family protein n=1 Tax=Paenibacillus sp. 1781tsa1 TaxID=2953810 RepID=UPI0020A19A9F|nr:PqqD family protein [Paenibacillus sp. 1781tsa1]MCP1182179.1 PqqD family protein [Paenibacillus sp. 1781tsa1]